MVSVGNPACSYLCSSYEANSPMLPALLEYCVFWTMCVCRGWGGWGGRACKGLHLLGRIMDEFICLLLWMFWTRFSPRLLVRMGDNLSLKIVGQGRGGARSWTLCGRVIWVCSLPSVCFGGWRCGMWKQRLILPLNPSKIWCELRGKKHQNQGCVRVLD